MTIFPSYLKLYEKGILEEREEKLYEKLKKCNLCPRNCQVNRLKDEKGFCCVGKDVYISSYNVHMGEEPPLSGTYGSGTIFFTHCNLKCVFCQNYPISQLGQGKKVSIYKLAEIMLYLQNKKCHNINFVTPTHVISQILSALILAIKQGLRIPLVYNTGGYETLPTLKLLEGIIDIYLPDIKYGTNQMAKKYSGVHNYCQYNQLALKEMYCQVGNLVLDSSGIAKKGLIIRHLVLPNNIASSYKVFTFIAKELSCNIYLSLMSQYFPAYKAYTFKSLNRKITSSEYNKVLFFLKKLNINHGWFQEFNTIS